MQFSGTIFTEVINICLICAQTTTMDVIMNFIALGVIAEIDDFYAGSLTEFPLKNALEEPPKIKISSKSIPFKQRDGFNKFVRVFYRTLRVCYASYYFYFMAFTVVPITYVLGVYIAPEGPVVIIVPPQ